LKFIFLDSHIPTNEQQTEAVHSTETEIHIDDLENYSDDEDDEEVSGQLREQYALTHGLRRHTAGRPDLLIHHQAIPTLTPNVRFAHQSTSIEPMLLTNRLHQLQQQQQQQQQYNTLITTPENNNHQFYSVPQSTIFHQRNSHSTSYNGLSGHSNITAVSEASDQQQKMNHWLSPPVSNTLRMLFNETLLISSSSSFSIDLNRRASDSGAHLLLFQQQHDVTGSNTIDPVRPAHIQSPVSNVKQNKKAFQSNKNSLFQYSSDHHEEVSHVVRL
jgi:hypothetical protein